MQTDTKLRLFISVFVAAIFFVSVIVVTPIVDYFIFGEMNISKYVSLTLMQAYGVCLGVYVGWKLSKSWYDLEKEDEGK